MQVASDYEYRRGQKVLQHRISNPLFNVVINETISAFNVNGVAVSKPKLAKAHKNGNATYLGLLELLCFGYGTAPETLKPEAPDYVRYLSSKLVRIYERIGVTSREKDALFCLSIVPFLPQSQVTSSEDGPLRFH